MTGRESSRGSSREARSPVLVGVAGLSQRVDDPREAREPLLLMEDAARAAARDAEAPSLLERVDGVRVMRGLWDYADPGRILAGRLGCPGAESGLVPLGGNGVQAAVHRTCLDIQAGQRDVVLLVAAEWGLTQSRARRRGLSLPQTPAPGEPDWTPFPDKPMVGPAEMARRFFQPTAVYPLFENALRHAAGRSRDAHTAHIAALWSAMSRVAADNPDAWIRRAFTPEEIATPGPDNRLVGFPYTKRMNSNNAVDQAAALLLCSREAARRAGIPEARWVHPVAGVDADDAPFLCERDDLGSSPAIRIAGARCLELAGVTPADLDFVDLYSCFPSAVQVAAAELGLSLERPLTVTGGMSFAGGPLNSYVMHAIARSAALLRQRPEARALVTANGGFLTKHALGVYSGVAPEHPFRHDRPQAAVDATPRREAVVDWEGDADLESFTVLHGREGPEVAYAACRLHDGRRTLATQRDPACLAELMGENDPVGRRLRLDGAGGFVLG